ncbi:MAG TPA: arginine--tRNA ligase, partial [Caldisericia bacterium]|nr:arginine--tRNA ligase [Caldisericia bacterium]
MSIKTHISKIFSDALEKMGVFDVEAGITRPDSKEHGDYSTNVAMGLSKQLKKPPRAIAEEIVSLT